MARRRSEMHREQEQRKRRCRNCPDEPTPEPPAPKAMTLVAGEAEKLWHQALLTCNTVVEMMAGYSMLGVPGNPVRQLRRLVGRLNEIITTCESREAGEKNEDQSPVE